MQLTNAQAKAVCPLQAERQPNILHDAAAIRWLASILAFPLATAALFWTVTAQAQMQSSTAYLALPCFPSPFVDDAMASQGFTSRLTGAFDDGDLLVVYRNAQGRFMAGFATPQGQTCALGQGSGLETHDIQAPKRGS